MFTERFSKECLDRVFGKQHVFTNVDINHKNTRVGEIDVLVIYANRAIILQAKSKKLTIEARKGNDKVLKDDFKKAIQDAYEQAYQSANYLLKNEYKLIGTNGIEIDIKREFKEIYPFCISSEHYPSLCFQSFLFLEYQTTDAIMPPFVCDVFFLDVLCEILSSPLYFLSYINRRVQYRDTVNANNEFAIFSYHIKNNLWIEDKNTLLTISDDMTVDVDLAMYARRDNIPGESIPEGILTRYQNTFFKKMVDHIHKIEKPKVIDFGFFLLTICGESIDELNQNVLKLREFYQKDNKNHDFSMVFTDSSTGVTIHCNSNVDSIAIPELLNHCKYRKQISKANNWFGVCIDPETLNVRFIISSM